MLWLPFFLEVKQLSIQVKSCWPRVQTSSSDWASKPEALWGLGEAPGSCEDVKVTAATAGSSFQSSEADGKSNPGLLPPGPVLFSLYYAVLFLKCYC